MKLNKSKKLYLGLSAAAVLSMSVAGGVSAAEVNVVKPPTKAELDARTGLDSNKDAERRGTLEKEFGIKLDKKDVWEDKKGQKSVNPDGTISEYTSHDEMKSLGFYAVNANRQELIKYAIRTGDWQPYRALEAKTSPAYFEIVNGKYEYTKVYYGHLLESDIRFLKEIEAKGVENLTNVSKEFKVEDFKKSLKERIKDFNDAPGVVPYVVGLNHNEATAKEFGVPTVSNDFFDSKYNHPDVLSKGIFVKEDKVKEEVKEEVKEKVATENKEEITVTASTASETVDIVSSVVESGTVADVRPPTKSELDARTGLDSNDDAERREALENKFNIKLDTKTVWEDKKGQTTIDANGIKHAYTSHDELKSLGIYAVNANRQELIKHAISTGDWQPYREFTALESPLYFERVDGKLEYSKIYYGNSIENTVSNYNSRITEAYAENDYDKVKELEAAKDKEVRELKEKFVKAPGVVPYVIGFNSSDSFAKQYGVEQVASDFFDSKYNNPYVLDFGRFTQHK